MQENKLAYARFLLLIGTIWPFLVWLIFRYTVPFFPSFHNLKRSVEGCFLCLWAWVKEAVLVGEIRKKKRKLGVRWYIVANLITKTIKQC